MAIVMTTMVLMMMMVMVMKRMMMMRRAGYLMMMMVVVVPGRDDDYNDDGDDVDDDDEQESGLPGSAPDGAAAKEGASCQSREGPISEVIMIKLLLMLNTMMMKLKKMTSGVSVCILQRSDPVGSTMMTIYI